MAPPRDVPQCNPLAGYRAQAADIDAAIARTLRGGRYILGPEVAAFEQEFAAFVGTKHAVGVASGTDAIAIALRALGVGPGDVVLTVSHSAVATTAAIRAAGATPLFVDVDEERGLLDLARAEELLELASRGRIAGVRPERIKALLPVHLYGACADHAALTALAQRYRLALVEDCAQAHGARSANGSAGAVGEFGCFSFYPTKNLGALGDGGAIAMSDAALHERVRLLREYGWRQRYVSEVEGTNSRLDELQAAILRVKLQRLAEDNAARRAIAAIYRARIRHPAVAFATSPDEGHVYHQFTIRTEHREALQAHLRQSGIGTLVHYPRAIHEQPAYADPAFRPLPLTQTEHWSRQVLSLPMFPQLAAADAEHVAASINAWNAPR